MFGSIGGSQGIGGPLSSDSIGGENFIRHIGNDKLIFDFKSGSGTTIKDRSCEGNDGTFGAGAAAPTWKRNSLYFDGGDYVLLTGMNHGISTGEFTFYAYFSSWESNAKVFFDQQTNRIYLHIDINAKVNVSTNVISDAISDLNLLDIQITRDSSGNLECYIRGKIQSKGQSDSFDITYNGSSIQILGANYSPAVQMIATINSFRILNKCLSGIEIQQIYLSQKFAGNN